MPAAREVTAEQALSANFKERFLMPNSSASKVTSSVLDMRSKEKTLVMQQGGTVFNAHFVGEALTRFCSSLRAGSLLKLTGVCSVQVDANRYPKSFQIYLRSTEDITVLRSSIFGPLDTPWRFSPSWLPSPSSRRDESRRTTARPSPNRVDSTTPRTGESVGSALSRIVREQPSFDGVYDKETLAFLAVNDAAVHHYGYTRNEFLG